MYYVISPLLVVLFVLLVIAGCRNQAPSSASKVAPLTTEEMDNASDDEIEGMILDNISARIEGNRDTHYQFVTSMSAGCQMLYATWWVEAEVNNGGFNQYFWNSSGQFANEALDGFRLIGATQYADLMQRAIATHIAEEPTQQQFKERGDIKAFSESYEHTNLNQLDDEFFELYEKEDISALRVQYIREHIDEFVGE